jgi:ribosomal-protein-alanine N-acetyltransferase
MPEIQTERLRLIALNPGQLERYVTAPEQLEGELGMPISREIVTHRLLKAISTKLSKMELVDAREFPWYTYWLIVIAETAYGAGLAGFKGSPDDCGEVEIGYGIDPAFRNRGYMTEAAEGLIQWAFQDWRCKAVIAPNTRKDNVASSRVLEKVGMRVYGETEETWDWRIDRAQPA